MKFFKKLLDLMLFLLEMFVIGVNLKFVGVNGCRIFLFGKEVKCKCGCLFKLKFEFFFELDNILSDVFYFIGEDE